MHATDPVCRTPRWLVSTVICLAMPYEQVALAAAPTIEDTNRQIKASNGYRKLVFSKLEWRDPVTQECATARHRLEQLTKIVPLVPPEAVSDPRVIEQQQRAEENEMVIRTQFSELLYDAIKQGCVDDSAVSEPGEAE